MTDSLSHTMTSSTSGAPGSRAEELGSTREVPRHQDVSGELAEMIPLRPTRGRKHVDPLFEADLLISEIVEDGESADPVSLSNKFDEWRRILANLPCEPSADGVDFVDLVATLRNATYKLDVVDVSASQLDALAEATHVLRARGAVREADLERAHARLRSAGLRSRLLGSGPADTSLSPTIARGYELLVPDESED